VVRIGIPPLRERKDDLDPLIDYFLQKYSPQKKLIIPVESRNKLHSYTWPGNIRELENTVHSAIVTASEGFLAITQLPLQSISPKQEFSFISLIEKGMSFKNAVNYFEKVLIEEALKSNENNQSKTAEYLKMNRRLLYSKMKELKFAYPDNRKTKRETGKS
jgi:transcriptional regulator with PAS, ATPase and Fis domain